MLFFSKKMFRETKKNGQAFCHFKMAEHTIHFLLCSLGMSERKHIEGKSNPLHGICWGKHAKQFKEMESFFTEHNNLMKYRRHGKKFMSCSPMIQSNEGRKGGGLRFEATPLQVDKGF